MDAQPPSSVVENTPFMLSVIDFWKAFINSTYLTSQTLALGSFDPCSRSYLAFVLPYRNRRRHRQLLTHAFARDPDKQPHLRTHGTEPPQKSPFWPDEVLVSPGGSHFNDVEAQEHRIVRVSGTADRRPQLLERERSRLLHPWQRI